MIGGIQTEVVVAFAVLDTAILGLSEELFQEAEFPGLAIDGICQVGKRLTRAASFYPGPLRSVTVKYMWMASPLQDQDHVPMSITSLRST